MPKICGCIGGLNDQTTIQRHLESMVAAMAPGSEDCIVSRCFDNGGIALIGAAGSAGIYLESAPGQASFAAVCGELVDSPRDHTIPDALSEDAPGFLATLNGVFALAHYNAQTGSLLIANDCYGFMPLYYYSDEQIFVFASEVKAILKVVGQQPFDCEAWADFFYIGHMLGQKTLFRTIHAFDSAQILTYCNGKVAAQQYADFTQTAVLARQDVSTETVATLFTQAVRRRASNDTQNTVLLSGGVDSRLVLGALHSLNVQPNVVTLEHASEKQGADGKYALLLAQSLGLPADYRRTRQDFFASNDWLETFYKLDGMIPNLGLFIAEIYPELDPSLGRVWDGLALDVALGGSHQVADGLRANVKQLVAPRRTNRRLLRLILTPRQFQRIDKNFRQRLSSEIARIPRSENQFLYFLLKNRTRRRIAVNPHQLIASRVEPVTPAADRDFMHYVLGIPSTLKLNHALYLDMLKHHFPFLMSVPIISGGAILDFERKPRARRFVKPLRALKKTLKRVLTSSKLLYSLLWSSSTATSASPTGPYASMSLIIAVLEQKHFDRPFYNQRLLRWLFTLYRSGRADYHKLFVLVCYIELWHRLFIDDDSPLLFSPQNLKLPQDRIDRS